MEKKNLAIIILAIVLAASGVGNIILGIQLGFLEVLPPARGQDLVYGPWQGDIVDLDPQIKAREVLLRLHHPVIGDYLQTRWPFIMSKTPANIRRGPLIGEDNNYICTEILGITDEEFVKLMDDEVII